MKEDYCDIYYRGYVISIEEEKYLEGDSEFSFVLKKENDSWSKARFSNLVYVTPLSVIRYFLDYVDTILGKSKEKLLSKVVYKGHKLEIHGRYNQHTSRLIYSGQSKNPEFVRLRTDYMWILEAFRKEVDNMLANKQKKEKTYKEVYQEWGKSRYKRVNYKDKTLVVMLVPRGEDEGVFYVGYTYYYPNNHYKDISFESIHYDKVIAKFEKFVDEYCTDWSGDGAGYPNPREYKGQRILIRKEKDKEFYIGYVRFHKNSTFKHIAHTREEVERCCKNRIDKVIYEKEKVQRKMLTPKQEKIKELEELLARISTQLEELKKEKDTLTYKYVILEISTGKNQWGATYFEGVLKELSDPAPFRENSLEDLKKSFEKYVDKLESQYLLFCKLTGKDF